MRSFEEIVRLTQDMQRVQGPVVSRMRDVLNRYDGEWVIPMPDLKDEPVMPQLTPALIAEAVDAMAMRASSVMPMTSIPALARNKDTGPRSKEYATVRRKIIAGTYHLSKWKLGRRRFYRHLSAYHTGALIVLPDFENEMVRLHVRDPLSSFAEPQAAEELRPPDYVSFLYRHSGEYLMNCYPQLRADNGGPITTRDTNELWDVCEWVDEDQIVFGLVGPVHPDGMHINTRAIQAPWRQLGPVYPNKCDHMPAIVPHNVALGKIASRMAAMIGNVDLQAKMMALNIIAAEKAIFPDVYAIGRQNGAPQIIGEQWRDGRTGDINMLMDIEQVGVLRSAPDVGTAQTIDRLERNFRASTGLVPQFSGETYGALRTGAGVNALGGMAVDPRIQEMHEISEAWMPHVNSAILSSWKGYFGGKRTFFSGWPSDRGLVEFDPGVHIESTENTVSYAIAGADVIQQTQILGSLFGAKAISARTFRERHPWIDDPEAEGAMVDEEAFEDALRQSILQKLVSGELPPTVAVLMRNHMQEGNDIFSAVLYADEEMRKRQATVAPPAPEGMIAAPEAMPGMAAGPTGMQQPPAEAPMQAADQVAVPQGTARMRQLMQAFQGGQ